MTDDQQLERLRDMCSPEFRNVSTEDKELIAWLLRTHQWIMQALICETRQRSQKPDFATFVELKHGIVGAILWALQNGEISRSKAAEALAEVAHGATDVQLPKVADAIPEDVTPLELWERAHWRPITAMHEDLGLCVLMDINDPGRLAIGNNLDIDFDDAGWTHFHQISRLTHEDAERMREEGR